MYILREIMLGQYTYEEVVYSNVHTVRKIQKFLLSFRM